MAISLTKMDPTSPNYRWVMLGKGESGCGKTTGLASWAVLGPMYILDLDRRVDSLNKTLRHKPEILKNIFYDSFNGYQDSFDKLEKLHDDTKKANYKCIYKSLLYDGLTPLGRDLMNQGISQRIEDNKGDAKKLADMVKRANIYVPQIEDYLGESQGISNILTLLRSVVFEKAGVNIFVTGHVVEVETRNRKNEITSVSRTMLTGGKKIAAEIPAYFNEIWHFANEGSISNPKYVANTVGSGGGEGLELGDDVAAKDFARSALLLPNKIDFTYPKTLYEEVVRYLKGGEELIQKERKEKPGGNVW